MALSYRPPDFIERAAEEERWTDSDRRHCERMLREAFEETFRVEQIQHTGIGLIAYGSPYSQLESVPFTEGSEKPVLRALGDLSRRLLRAKNEREKSS